MSPEVVQFLLNLLGAQTVSVGASDFDQTVAIIQQSRDELVAQLPVTAQTLRDQPRYLPE